jgi:hypothetical protein
MDAKAYESFHAVPLRFIIRAILVFEEDKTYTVRPFEYVFAMEPIRADGGDDSRIWSAIHKSGTLQANLQ